MQLWIALVFVLKMFGVQSRSFFLKTVDQVIIPPHTPCKCTPYSRCYDEERRSEETGIHLSGVVVHHPFVKVALLDVAPYDFCPSKYEICCNNLTPPSTTTTVNQSPRPLPHDPSQMYPELPTREDSLQPKPQAPPQIIPQIPQNTNVTCTCTPFFGCYDEETSSNLTDVVDDRSSIQESCPDSNDVCCYNLVQPLPQITIQPLPPSSSQITPSSHTDCICTPFFRCYDNETSSNLTDVVDDRSHIPVRKDSCQDQDDICCHNLVQPLSTKTPSLLIQSKSLYQISPQILTSRSTLQHQPLSQSSPGGELTADDIAGDVIFPVPGSFVQG